MRRAKRQFKREAYTPQLTEEFRLSLRRMLKQTLKGTFNALAIKGSKSVRNFGKHRTKRQAIRRFAGSKSRPQIPPSSMHDFL